MSKTPIPSKKIKETPFWERKTLDQMTKQEWESLCDGCARCCLIKLEDVDTGNVDYTDIACKLLDINTCKCKGYPDRKKIVPDCIVLDPQNIKDFKWMPSTCAYRLLAEGKSLEWWHPLLSGDPKTVHQAKISVKNRVVNEKPDDILEDRIVSWPKI